MSTPPDGSAFPYLPPFEAQFHEGRAQEFIIQRLIGAVHTMQLVKVLAVRDVSDRVGFLDVQPMLQEVDTAGVLIDQAPIYNVPFMRYQGGSSAVILDPAIGDIGLCAFAECDITAIKKTLQAGAPATARTHSSADGLYIGGVLNPAPTQYVRFNPSGGGIDIHSPGTVTLSTPGNVHVTAATCIFDCNVVFNQNVSSTQSSAGTNTFAAPIVAPDAIINGVTQSTHIHGGVQTGGGNSTGPHN